MHDFVEFIRKYNVLGLGLAIVIGTAAKDLVNALVSDILMPIIGVILPGGSWREAVLRVGTVEFGIGHLIGVSLDFILIALFLYFFVRYVLRMDKVEKL